ncbi:hypothetical protein D3C77_357940 [compost metagenome]
MDPDRLYHELGYLIAEMPDWNTTQWQTPEGQQWLGRAAALIEQGGNFAEIATFNVATQNLHSTRSYVDHVQSMTAILYRTLARVELQASPSVRGAFIPVGEAFSAFTALAKILTGARSAVMFVDPFADANLLTDFTVLVPEGIPMRILADASGGKPALAPAVRNWAQQYGSARPLEARLAPSRSLHDRLIIIDGRDSWSLGQSFNALAARAPTSLLRADVETALLKIQAHVQIWEAADPIE